MSLPHVSAILAPFSDFSMVKEDVLLAAGERGTRVHAGFFSHLLGVWSPRLPEFEQPYLDSSKRWADKYVIRLLADPEKYLEDPAFGFCGTLDLLLELSIPVGAACGSVVDLKTPKIQSKTWDVQVGGAYLRLAQVNGYPIEMAGTLQPDPEGGIAKVIWCPNPKQSLAVFLSALNCHRYFSKS